MDDIPESAKVRLFISYAHDDAELNKTFQDALFDPAITQVTHIFDDRLLRASSPWDDQILHHLRTADIVLLLVSDRFLASRYIMEKELPLARVGAENGKSAVWVVRMRPCDLAASEAADLACWPEDGQALVDLDDARAAIAPFRDTLKQRICEVLLTNESRRQARAGDDQEQQEHGLRNLRSLHQTFGERFDYRRPVLRWGAGGALSGAALGALVSTYVIQTPLPHWYGPALYFGAAGAFGGLLRAVFLMFKTDKESASRNWLFELILLCTIGSVAALANGLRTGLLGLLIGAVLALGDWQMAPGPLFGSVIWALIAAFYGVAWSWQYADRRLQVFLDAGVGDDLPVLPDDATVEEGPDLSASRSAVAAAKTEQSVSAPVATPAPRRDDETEAALARPAWEEPARSLDEVRLRLAVIGNRQRSRETAAFHATLEQEGLDDVFAVEEIDDGTGGAEEAAFWQDVFSRCSHVVVLLTRAFCESAAHAALAQVFQETPRAIRPDVTPVAVDDTSVLNSPLLEHQCLPSGGMPVADWPVAENAWRNVVRHLRQAAMDPFRGRLLQFNETRIEDKALEAAGLTGFTLLPAGQSADPDAEKDPGDEWRAFRLLQGDEVSAAREDFYANTLDFPYRHRRWDLRLGAWLRWCLWGTVVFAFFGWPIAEAVIRVGGTAWQYALLAPPLLLLALPFLLLCLHEEVVRHRLGWEMGKDRPGRSAPGVINALFDFFSLAARRPMFRRATMMLARAIAATVVVAGALIIADAAWQLGLAAQLSALPTAPMIGLVMSTVGYLATRRRLPAILMPRPIPEPTSWTVVRRGWTLEILSAHANAEKEEEGAIGGIEAADPEPIRQFAIRITLSPLLFVRAALDAAVLCVSGVVIMIVAVNHFDLSYFHVLPVAAWGTGICLTTANLGPAEIRLWWSEDTRERVRTALFGLLKALLWAAWQLSVVVLFLKLFDGRLPQTVGWRSDDRLVLLAVFLTMFVGRLVHRWLTQHVGDRQAGRER